MEYGGVALPCSWRRLLPKTKGAALMALMAMALLALKAVTVAKVVMVEAEAIVLKQRVIAVVDLATLKACLEAELPVKVDSYK